MKENPAAPVLSEGRVLGVAAFLALPIAAFAPKGMAPLLALSSLLLLGLTYRQAGSLMAIFRQFPKPMVAVLGVFLVYATLSVFWSINPAGTMRSVLGIGLAFLGGLVVVSTAVRLTKTDQDFFERALVAGGLFGFGLIGFELLSDTAISRILITLKGGKVFENGSYTILLNSGMSVAALYVWPWLLALRRRYGNVVSLVGAVAAGGVLVLGESEAPLLALAFGFVITAAAMTLPGKVSALPGAVSKTAIIAIVLAVAGAPLLPGALPDPLTESAKMPYLSNSAQHRLVIWRTTANHIAERPIRGHGQNGTRALYGKSDRVNLTFATDDKSRTWTNIFEPIPLHPHNGVLQIWLELGAVGAALLAAFLLVLLRSVAKLRAEKIEWAACFGLLATGLIIFSLSYGAWQGWWQGTLWLLGAFMAATAGERKEVKPPVETGGPTGPEPTRYGDWEKKGRCIDF
ncbi:MAG: DUF1674 domain-containing protein [Rhodospirillaceae bacterium]|nr:DUF1674 domain-containing protein [Rhodospirillaceae bacterium]MBT4219481.1 DUF1674 domain-containing protein [Rhodospirillaceae bacterium]MBT4463621.1 DUF1674 domain-containing protein [Rhodospirillaceae bacterium]MBT5309559.1 DUF1674 domain-containing protein [Rhodospirillaceae bacterium]MBT6406063.1 DUF1674 domain-containing protein [Rhodospirillaceae bacterium]